MTPLCILCENIAIRIKRDLSPRRPVYLNYSQQADGSWSSNVTHDAQPDISATHRPGSLVRLRVGSRTVDCTYRRLAWAMEHLITQRQRDYHFSADASFGSGP